MMTDCGRIRLERRQDGFSVLFCPRCGENYLHHGSIVVYDRAEDQPLTIKTTVNGLSTKSEVVGSRQCSNPSSRRDGIVIRFECEACSTPGSAPLELTIAQHKGETHLAWRFEPLPADCMRACRGPIVGVEAIVIVPAARPA